MRPWHLLPMDSRRVYFGPHSLTLTNTPGRLSILTSSSNHFSSFSVFAPIFSFSVSELPSAVMAMRRLLTSSHRVRSFSTAPAQVAEPALSHGEIGEVSGIPEEHLKRKVVIYSPSRCTTQSGPATSQWKISFGSVNKWENPLMGWTSTGDPYHSVGEASLNFDSKARAVEFAEKYGWQYTVREPQQATLKPRTYADNFKWKGPAPEFD